MEESKIKCVGDEGVEISDVISIIRESKATADLENALWEITTFLKTPLSTVKRFRSRRDNSSTTIPPFETLQEILDEWVQRVNRENSYLTTLITALEKSHCGDMASLLRNSYNLPPQSNFTIEANINLRSPISTPGSHSTIPNDLTNESILSKNQEMDPMLHAKNLTDDVCPSVPKNESTKKLYWIIGCLCITQIATATVVILYNTTILKTGLLEHTCSIIADPFIWLNVTSFQEYSSKSIAVQPKQGIKLGIKMNSLYDWPPDSLLHNPCDIVELHITGFVDDLRLISLLRQLPSVKLITIDGSDCSETIEVLFNTQLPQKRALDQLQKITKNCLKTKVQDTFVHDQYQKLTVNSYSDYKKQLMSLPGHMHLELTISISVPKSWPNMMMDNNMLRVKKLSLIGPFSKESLTSILLHAKQIEELHLIDSKTGICNYAMTWDSLNKPLDNQISIVLESLGVLHFENFTECRNIYELFSENTRSDKLHTFKLERVIVTASNLNHIHQLLKANHQSLEKLNFILSKWDVSFFKHLNTKFARVSDLEIDFINQEKVPNFLTGLLCDDFFPFLKNLIISNGFLPFDDINIVLKCDKLKNLKFAIHVPNTMEPLRMNIFKSVLSRPPNFTLFVFFYEKRPSEMCEVESIAGIEILSNCVLKTVTLMKK